MPPRYLVRGGNTLRGTVRPAGNKNAALPAIAATVLAEGPVELDNMPRIRDVETMLAILSENKPLDPRLCARIRASILLAGPLLARFGRVTLPPPGGDVIGRRRVDTHFLALEALGAEVHLGDSYELFGKALRGADITASVDGVVQAGIANGLHDDGALRLRTGAGETLLHAGEVSLRKRAPTQA